MLRVLRVRVCMHVCVCSVCSVCVCVCVVCVCVCVLCVLCVYVMCVCVCVCSVCVCLFCVCMWCVWVWVCGRGCVCVHGLIRVRLFFLFLAFCFSIIIFQQNANLDELSRVSPLTTFHISFVVFIKKN